MRSARTEQARLTHVLVLDVHELEPFEIGARLDALLCYPTWSAERRDKIADAICAQLLAYSIAQDPGRKGELSRKYRQYAKSKNRTKLNSIDGRREKALKIGLAFLPHLKEPAIGELPELHGERGKLTLAETVRFVWPERQRGPDFVYEDWLKDREKDVRAYRPIAHLAAAYQWIARELAEERAFATFDYQDIDYHREAVRRANEFAGYFRASSALTQIARRLIDIEWRE